MIASGHDWSPPRPAPDAELARHQLPVDVQVGSTVFRAGVSLLQLVAQHRALYAHVYPASGRAALAVPRSSDGGGRLSSTATAHASRSQVAGPSARAPQAGNSGHEGSAERGESTRLNV